MSMLLNSIMAVLLAVTTWVNPPVEVSTQVEVIESRPVVAHPSDWVQLEDGSWVSPEYAAELGYNSLKNVW